MQTEHNNNQWLANKFVEKFFLPSLFAAFNLREKLCKYCFRNVLIIFRFEFISFLVEFFFIIVIHYNGNVELEM